MTRSVPGTFFYSRTKWPQVLLFASYVAIIVAFLFPLIWVFSLSLKGVGEVYSFPPRIIPENVTLQNYGYIFWRTRVPLYLWNSAKITVLTILGSLLISIPFAYALSRFRVRFRGNLLFILLMFQMLSPMIIAVPLYRYYVQIGLVNTHVGVVLIYIALQGPFATWILKGFFDSLPTSLDDAALIDGCNRFEALRRVILPNSLPGLMSATIIISVRSWSQFIVPFVLLESERLLPISVGILNYSETEEQILLHLLATASIVSVLPTIGLFVVLQRFIVGALAGATKE